MDPEDNGWRGGVCETKWGREKRRRSVKKERGKGRGKKKRGVFYNKMGKKSLVKSVQCQSVELEEKNQHPQKEPKGQGGGERRSLGLYGCQKSSTETLAEGQRGKA